MGKIQELMEEFDDEALLDEVNAEMEGGTEPLAIIDELQQAMVEIGEKFNAGELFVSDLMMAGAMFQEVMEVLKPHLASGEGAQSKGTVVLGTVKEDIHDIGKDIVKNMLEASGFEVADLGVDVDPAAFVKAVQDSNAKVLGLSCLLASCYGSLKETVDAVEAAGLRDKVKIIIGGGPIDEHVVDFCGADAFGVGAQDTVDFAKEVYA